MGWPFKTRAAQITAADLLGWRTAQRAGIGVLRNVTREQALRTSAAWACLRLRADLISTMPVDVYRRVFGLPVEVPKPAVLVNPGGERVSMVEWLYSTQFDLDGVGNTFGIITERDGNGLPSRIDLVPVEDVVVQVRDNALTYRIGNEVHQPADIWHERQFTTSGSPVGLSPLGHAAASLNGYLSAQDFAAAWFSGGTIPNAILKNTAKKVNADEAQNIKDRFKASMSNGDTFVTGADWDYQMVSAKASEAMFLEERRFGLTDICRFLGVPGDMIDAEDGSKGSAKITYANVTQRNLQLLILNLAPAITRRERALSDLLLQRPRYVKLNADAILRMDLKTRYEAHAIGLNSRFVAPSEVRALEDLAPFTESQIGEFDRLFGAPSSPPVGVPIKPASGAE